MPLVNILLNGKAFTLACDEGEENRLKELGAFIDRRVQDLSSQVGQIDHARLILMASLVVADELSEALTRVDERDKEVAELKRLAAASAASIEQAESRLAEILENAATRLETIAVSVAAP